MTHLTDDLGFSAAFNENISGTTTRVQHDQQAVNSPALNAERSASGTCSFVIADGRSGGDPFCGASTRRGSSYCARHHPLCIVPRRSVEGRSRAAVLIEEAKLAPKPPPELAHLRETALPEPLPDDPRDLRALLDHPPPNPAMRELD